MFLRRARMAIVIGGRERHGDVLQRNVFERLGDCCLDGIISSDGYLWHLSYLLELTVQAGSSWKKRRRFGHGGSHPIAPVDEGRRAGCFERGEGLEDLVSVG